MSFIPSLLLYNPLEAFWLLLCCYLFRDDEHIDKKFNLKDMIIKTYLFSTVLFVFQYFLGIFYESLIFIILNQVFAAVVTPFLLSFFQNENKIEKCFVIFYLYLSTLNLGIFIFSLPTNPLFVEDSVATEFYGNILIKSGQFIILIGAYIMKKMLKKVAQKNLGKTIASTVNCWGEPKLTEKLQKEIKQASK